MRALFNTQQFRFLVGGAVNSAVTYAIYLGLVRSLGDALAYTTAYLFGIALAYLINGLYVFRARLDLRSALGFPTIYVVLYLTGLALLWVFVSGVELPRYIAMLLVIVVNAVLAFFLTRLVFSPRDREGTA